MLKEINKKGVGVVVGRFQVPELHDGHLSLLREANKHNKLLIFVGIHPFLVTPSDPLDFPTREQMIKEALPNAMVVALPDHPSDEQWSKDLDKLIRTHCPLDQVTLYCGRHGFNSRYYGSFEVKEIDPISIESGTSIRENVSQQVMASSEFRAGVIYGAFNKWPVISPVVDIALLRQDHKGDPIRVLLGQKEQQPHYWRFPGGFIDLNDSTAESAAQRELSEETGIYCEKLEYVCSTFIDDWRCTDKNKLFTFFYKGWYTDGAAQANDDLHVVSWIPVHDVLRRYNMVKNHQFLMKQLINNLEKEGYKLGSV